MSIRIKALEEELGQRLFDRERKGVALTEAGAVLFASAEKIFADVEEARERLRELKESGLGRVRLGCSDTVSLYLLPPLLRRFRRRYPKAEIIIRNAYTGEILDLLVRGELDFGIVTKPVAVDRRLEWRPLFDEPYLLACARGDPIARRAAVPLAALDGRDMVALERGTVTREATDRALKAAGAQPRIVLETGNIEVQKRYVAIGFGCALLPRCALPPADLRRLAVRPLEAADGGADLVRTVVVVYKKDRYLPRPAEVLLGMLGEREGRP